MAAAFTRFDILSVRKKGDIASNLNVYLGKSKTVDAIIPHDINIGLPKADTQNVKLSLTHNAEIIAPIQQGQEIGQLTIDAPGQPSVTVPVLAAKTVESKKGLSRAISVLKSKIGGE